MATSAEEETLASRFLDWSDLLRSNAEEMMDLTEFFFFDCFDKDCLAAVGSGLFNGEGSGLFFAASRRSINLCFDLACVFFFRVGFMPRKSSPKPYAPPIVVRFDAFGVLESRRGGASVEVDFCVPFSLPGRNGAVE